jgi:hypothetical protein
MGETEIIGLSDEARVRLKILARNLLLEYRLAAGPHRGCVPHLVVEKLMQLYGATIAKEIFESMSAKASSLITDQNP